MQHQLTKGPLLDSKGHLIEAGYATHLIKDYRRSDIKVKGMRIKEWDYYYIGNTAYGCALTIADNDYLWLTSVTFFDFDARTEHTSTQMGFFPRGKLNLPETSEKGDISLELKNHTIRIQLNQNTRKIQAVIQSFHQKETMLLDVSLVPSIKDSMVIATPFHKPTHFYYNQKINLLKAKGTMTIGSKKYSMNDCYGVLDWGRGVWTYKNTWYWSSLSGVQNGNRIGFNLGYGFGDTDKATENMLFFNDETHKFEDIIFDIPKNENHEDYMSPWRIHSQSKNIDLIFEPLLDRHSNASFIVLKSIQHQVFGYF
ncbi:MAG: DUF2804 domain-containing protein, partial [Candidatus Moranbacteria bacterium]|nr:DUF2804 domain-containing protein [Candidatus Moranbacteria bacterium]